jgi:alginate O-acetyltransferase complex protein AlgI
MVFSSLSFIFLFLPVVLFLFYVANPLFRPAILLTASLAFYFFGEIYLIWVMLATTVLNFVCGAMISGAWRHGSSGQLAADGPRSRAQKGWLALSIVGSLGFLFYFKYFSFLAENLNSVITALGGDSLGLGNVAKAALPLGISFYVFQSISYTIDVYHGTVAASRNLLSFTAYVTMFPQLVAGPIVRYADIEAQLLSPRCSTEAFADGVRRFLGGLAKKVLVANPMGQVADAVFALPDSSLSTGVAWIGIVAYALQIYFDFSGYSCMAIGLGKMFGFSFPENFKHPYVARSVREFWRRWHISLSTWFRDYLYVPLGGNRGSAYRTRMNLLLVFVACGLWHGASWTFVAWGLFHGFFLVLERSRFGSALERLPSAIRHAYLLLVVVTAWVFFRSETLAEAFAYIGRLWIYHDPGIRSVGEFLTTDRVLIMGLGILFATPLAPWLRNRLEQFAGIRYAAAEAIWMVGLVALFCLCVASLSAGNFNPFIYFRF